MKIFSSHNNQIKKEARFAQLLLLRALCVSKRRLLVEYRNTESRIRRARDFSIQILY